MDRSGVGGAAELLDLVCGPAGPVPETHQRYRLVQHLATGGQAEVYRAVRLSAGVSSAPVTVKVFRLDAHRTLADQLRSWDKGDAVLMDLNSRGVPGICRRADGFYGPPPCPPNKRPRGDSVPYQVLDYMHGINLRDYVRARVAGEVRPGAGKLSAPATLGTLARVLRALHLPTEPGASPVLHMDVKPSNVMVLPSGEVRLIDFTGARYALRDHITTIAYTAEAGGPEAFSGQVGISYDVHGFGAVAYFMVTGAFPRSESPDRRAPGDRPADPPVPYAVLRRHPLLDAHPELREHLLAPLADRPGDRPATEELGRWTTRLSELVRRLPTPDVGLDWGDPRTDRVVARAPSAQRTVAPADGAWNRIERLEQEVVELRAALGTAPVAGAAGIAGAAAASAANAEEPTVPGSTFSPEPDTVPSRLNGMAGVNSAAGVNNAANMSSATQLTPRAGGPRPGPVPHRPAEPVRPVVAGTRVMPQSGIPGGNPGPGQPPGVVGAAAVRAPDRKHARGPAREDTIVEPAAPAPPPQPAGPPGPPPPRTADVLRRGSEITITTALFAFVCWGFWDFDNRQSPQVNLILTLVIVLLVGVGLFILCRFIGRLVIERSMHKVRRGARLSHLAVGAYLVVCGINFLEKVSWFETAYNHVVGWIS